jgi:hypothetical protein
MTPYQTLQALERKYQRQLTSKNPSAEAIRKTREAIIKLKFDLVMDRAQPAYYNAEGGSMCNGIGRSYF